MTEDVEEHPYRPSGSWQFSLIDDMEYEPCLTCGLWKDHTIHAPRTNP
jgi:hypothetical protein